MIINPITKKRLNRFKEIKRSYYSFWLLFILYFISLSSEILCNSNPLYVRFNGRSYFPVFKFYPENIFTGSGRLTRPDYKKIQASDLFIINKDNYMIFTLFPFGPFESIAPESIAVPDEVTVVLSRSLRKGTVNISDNYTIERSQNLDFFLNSDHENTSGLNLKNFWEIPPDLQKAIETRFKNMEASSASFSLQAKDKKNTGAVVSLSNFSRRDSPPSTVRLTFSEKEDHHEKNEKIIFDSSLNLLKKGKFWDRLGNGDKNIILQRARQRFANIVESCSFILDGKLYEADFQKEDIQFPFHPVKGHILGIDGAGRDVLARILYGLRTSMTFGLILVFFSMLMGIFLGAMQGYYGGIMDMAGQRITEIWSALPFLYIMILMGSVYGRSFFLLLFCYGIFNWIGISYYMRAEFLRLRKQSFVEAAQCMGLSSFKIIFKHILPNALVPVITFFPFSLVGAIGSLAALDYLGFGLPPPTPSWGELLSQAQQYRWAWWLILYPSLSLFIVMILGIFVGEGVRNAYDPKRYSKLE